MKKEGQRKTFWRIQLENKNRHILQAFAVRMVCQKDPTTPVNSQEI